MKKQTIIVEAPKPRNPVATALASSKYARKVIPNLKGYNRKKERQKTFSCD